MVPRLHPHPLVDALALRVPAGRVPLRGAAGGQPRPRPGRARVRAARHRPVRRGPLLGHHGRVRQGLARRHLHPRPRAQRRPGGGHPAPAPPPLVPQPLVVGPGRPASGDRARRRRPERAGAGAGHDVAARGRRPRAALLPQPEQHRAAVERARRAVPQGRHQRPRGPRAADREPRRHRHEGGPLVPPGGGGRRHRGGAAAPGPRAGRPGRHLVGDHGGAGRRGRRLLRRHRAGRDARRGARDAPGVRGDALEQAVLPLRRGALAGRRPGRPAPAAGAPQRAQRAVAAPLQPRRHLDAGQVGVPLVRGLGPVVPLRDAGPGGPGVRQGAAAPDHARVVHARQRAAAGLRVGLRRRQPAGARAGRPAGVPRRRRARRGVAQAHLPQDAAGLHLVGQHQGHRRRQRLRRRLPGPGQHRAGRPLQAAGRRPRAGAGRRHRLDGALLPQHARDRAGAGPARPGLRGRRGQVLRALHPHPAGDQRGRAVGRGGRLLLRPDPPHLRRGALAGAGPLDDRLHPAVRRRPRRRARDARDGGVPARG